MEEINRNNVPKHIAIIMDGNGRWAKTKGKLRLFGHQNGITAVRETVEAAAKIGVKYLTLYAFSTENWSRPEKEVNALMTLLISAIDHETKTLIDNNIQLSVIGNIKQLPVKAQEKLNNSTTKTTKNTGMTLILALSYSSRIEIIDAFKKIIQSEKGLSEMSINEDLINKYLQTSSMPDPELLIRTSGERRISNFLLWQIAFTELYFSEKKWPDFDEEELYMAIFEYQKRERRFGKTSKRKGCRT